jgi:hypothetical protein
VVVVMMMMMIIIITVVVYIYVCFYHLICTKMHVAIIPNIRMA